MMTCEQCKFWDTGTSNFKSFGMGDCIAIPEEFYFDYDDEEQLAYTDDKDGYFSVLVTRPNFGCIMGREKET